jgi:hypothetical protein
MAVYPVTSLNAGSLSNYRQTLVNLRVNEMTTSVLRVQALGGGWDVARLPGAAQVASKDWFRRDILNLHGCSPGGP